ncbi:MAG: FG-GAP repeat domain-containing protein [Phycisphaerae bacterium]
MELGRQAAAPSCQEIFMKNSRHALLDPRTSATLELEFLACQSPLVAPRGNGDSQLLKEEPAMTPFCKSLAIATLAFAAAAQGATFGGFALRQDYAVGDGPRENVVADLNGDGVPDLATAHGNSDDIAVRLGIGDGTLAAAVFYPAGDTPLSLRAADLDGDGDTDLTVANGNGVSISVYFGNGDGTFVLHQTYAFDPESPPFPGVILTHAMADFDGDGDVDIAVATLTGTAIVILPNDGTGTFGPLQIAAEIGAIWIDLETGDFNGDGHVDIVTMDGPLLSIGTLRIRLNNGDGTFGAPLSSAMQGHGIVKPAADFNGDGLLDIAANATVNPGGYISVALGNGDGTIGLVTTYPVNRPSGITTADFDRDGNIDLAVTSFNTYNTVSVMLGHGDGAFAAPLPFATAGNPECPTAADLNGDSWLDVVTSNRNADSVSVLINLTEYPLGDLNCDGVLNNFDIDPFVLTLTDPAGYAAAYPECSMHNADVNCDGDVNNFDIDPFVSCLTQGGACPSCP